VALVLALPLLRGPLPVRGTLSSKPSISRSSALTTLSVIVRRSASF
jgi:hypothetical protein